MPPDFIAESIIWGPVFALGILAALTVLAVVLNVALSFVVRRRQQNEANSLDAQLLGALRGPILVFLVVLGAFLAFISFTNLTDPAFDSLRDLDDEARLGWLIAIIAVVSYTVTRLLQVMILWYVRKVAANRRSTIDTKIGPTVNRVLPLVIYSIGMLIALDSLGLTITPLLAGIGIGGSGGGAGAVPDDCKLHSRNVRGYRRSA